MQLKGSLEENVLTLLVWNEIEAPRLTLELTPDLFSNRNYRKIAGHAFEHIQKFGTPPKSHIRDLLEADLRRDDGKFLASVIDEMEKLQKEIQVKYVINQLDKFVEIRKLSNVIEDAADAIADGDTEKAREALYRQSNLVKHSAGIYLSDSKSALAFLDETDEELFSSGVEILDQRGIRPARGELFLFLAPAKRGKTWAAINVAKAALLNKQSVLHISLEMGEQRIAKRYVQALYAMSTKDIASIRVPTFKRDDLGRCTSIDFYNRTPVTINAENRDTIAAKLDGLKRRKPILIKSFPTRSLTISQLNAYLDVLERNDGFVPDLLIVDYPDIMRVDVKNLRLDTGRIYQELRGLAKERNVALFAPSQTSRASATAKLVTGTMVAEDWSKIATADCAITYSQTSKERSIGLARLLVDAARNDEDKFITLISQSYATGQFCIDSTYMSKIVENEVNVMTGEDEEE